MGSRKWFRSTAVLAVALVGVGAFDAGAMAQRKPKQKSERTVVLDYDAPAVGFQGAGMGPTSLDSSRCDPDMKIGCVHFKSKPGDRYVTIQAIDDASPLPVPMDIYVIGDTFDAFTSCGSEGPIELPKVGDGSTPYTVAVFVYGASIWVPGVFTPSCAGSATQGEVTATFSKSL